MTLCNLRRQKTLLKDYSMRVKHQTDRLIKISRVGNSSIRVCDDSGHRKMSKVHINPLSSSIHIQILQSDLHTFPLRSS